MLFVSSLIVLSFSEIVHHVDCASALLMLGVHQVLTMEIDSLAHVGLVGDRKANNVAHL